jgi:hypothetical protein
MFKNKQNNICVFLFCKINENKIFLNKKNYKKKNNKKFISKNFIILIRNFSFKKLGIKETNYNNQTFKNIKKVRNFLNILKNFSKKKNFSNQNFFIHIFVEFKLNYLLNRKFPVAPSYSLTKPKKLTTHRLKEILFLIFKENHNLKKNLKFKIKQVIPDEVFFFNSLEQSKNIINSKEFIRHFKKKKIDRSILYLF